MGILHSIPCDAKEIAPLHGQAAKTKATAIKCFRSKNVAWQRNDLAPSTLPPDLAPDLESRHLDKG
ncbi:hypothetical protein D3Y57_17260 [Sphingomonas paeninsulae]|uniref:Uncharacterized protein n=1 Tax=Sphingomonas paeninsulae TaxID=2319844 RepID=A0A494TD05_SPHPE|nr:hypothetical protein D3Y57_17260 [Sphingomonas paeninsulae]